MPRTNTGSTWANQPITLFHGTSLKSAQKILARGVDIQQCHNKRDFGKGFYTTTSEHQAEAFATKRAGIREIPAVLQLTVERGLLSELSALAFVRGEREANDYWNFVRNCRKGLPHRFEPSAYYDVVYGPVAVSWDDPLVCRVITNFDQVSFHTDKAQLLLNESPMEMIR